jgi:hypothetical protein
MELGHSFGQAFVYAGFRYPIWAGQLLWLFDLIFVGSIVVIGSTAKSRPLRPRREFAVLRYKMQTSGLSAWAGRPDDPGPSQRIRGLRSRKMKGHDQLFKLEGSLTCRTNDLPSTGSNPPAPDKQSGV